MLQMWGRGGGEKLVVCVVITTNSRCGVLPPVRGRIKRDVFMRHWDQEGHTISELDGFLPPVDILEEILRKDGWTLECGSKSLRSKTTVKE